VDPDAASLLIITPNGRFVMDTKEERLEFLDTELGKWEQTDVETISWFAGNESDYGSSTDGLPSVFGPRFGAVCGSNLRGQRTHVVNTKSQQLSLLSLPLGSQAFFDSVVDLGDSYTSMHVGVGDTPEFVLLGGPHANGARGQVLPITYVDGAYTLSTPFLGPNHTDAGFGSSVSCDVTQLICAVGAPSENGGMGLVYIYTMTGTGETRTMNQEQILDPGVTASAFAGFGVSVALSGDGLTLAVGGPSDQDQGAIWIYQRPHFNTTQFLFISKYADGSVSGTGATIGAQLSINKDGSRIAVFNANDDVHDDVRGTVTLYHANVANPEGWVVHTIFRVGDAEALSCNPGSMHLSINGASLVIVCSEGVGAMDQFTYPLTDTLVQKWQHRGHHIPSLDGSSSFGSCIAQDRQGRIVWVGAADTDPGHMFLFT
jgi:hypothetical protein